MKKVFKALRITLISIGCIYILFIAEESIRLSSISASKPLIVIDKIMCNKDHAICYDEDKKYTEKYISLGFVLKQDYYLDETSTNDNHIYHLYGEEFLLFNKIRLWAWAS